MNRNISKDTLKKFSIFLFSIFLVYSNGSWLTFEYPIVIKICLPLVLILVLLYKIVKTKKISQPNFGVIFMVLFPILSKFVNLSHGIEVLNTFSIAFIYLLLGFYHKSFLFKILDMYAQIIYYLSIISIFLGILFLINYSLLNIFPVHYNELFVDVNGYYNLIIYTDRVGNDFRTQSIFWEPGAWAFNEVFALYWYLFQKNNINIKVLPVFFFSLLLTLSTTGLLLLLLIIINIIIFSKNKKLKKTILVLIFTTIASIGLLEIYIGNRTGLDINQIIYTQTIDKLFVHDTGPASISADDRSSSSKIALAIALDNPISGIGRQSANNLIYVTSSIFELLYQFGFIYTFFFMYFTRKTFSKMNYIISIIFILVLYNGEAYAGYILSSLILIYGAKESKLSKYMTLSLKRVSYGL